MPLKTRAGSAEAPIDPGARDVVGAVGDRAAMEVVALDRARETLPLGDARDLHGLALLEQGVELQLVAHLELAGLAAELGQMPHRANAAFLRWPSSGLGQLLLAHAAEGDLHGVVAVALRAPDASDEAGPASITVTRSMCPSSGSKTCVGWLSSEQTGHDLRRAGSGCRRRPGRWSRRWGESTVLGVGCRMSISRLWVRISKCSRESLSLKGPHHAVDVLLGGEGHGPGHRRRCARPCPRSPWRPARSPEWS